MEKQSYISARQAVLILLLTRLPYSTAFIPDIRAGNSVQDILVAVAANFLLNFLFASPILLLMRRYPGKDILEIASRIGGKPLTAVLGVVYLVDFMLMSLLPINYFQQFYINSIIPEASYWGIIIPLLLMCLYAAVKGIESIARFSLFVMVTYILDILLIGATTIPSIHLGNLLPLFYNGPGVFERALISGANGNFQIVLLFFLAPFLHQTENPVRIFTRWNVIDSILLLLLQFLVVTVLGAFGTQQLFPIYALSRQSGVGVFDRLEAAEVIAWIMETLFEVSVFIYLAYICLTKMGLNSHRRLVSLMIGGVLLGVGWVISRNVFLLRGITQRPAVSAFTALTILVIPIGLLLADSIRRKAGQTS